MLLSRFRVVGHSMIPSLLPGDEILISSVPFLLSPPKPRDIVLISDPSSHKYSVKRIQKVENGTYLVQGDNVSDSHDSRTYGFIQRQSVVGKMLFKVS